jgi:hypothetical protein
MLLGWCRAFGLVPNDRWYKLGAWAGLAWAIAGVVLRAQPRQDPITLNRLRKAASNKKLTAAKWSEPRSCRELLVKILSYKPLEI